MAAVMRQLIATIVVSIIIQPEFEAAELKTGDSADDNWNVLLEYHFLHHFIVCKFGYCQ